MPLDLLPRGLGMDAAPMSSEERAPSVERPDPFGNPIVEILVEKRCGRRVDWGNGRRPCGYEGLVDDDVDLIKPFELGDIFEAQQPMNIKADRKPQRQNDCVFEKRFHGTASRSPRPSEP